MQKNYQLKQKKLLNQKKQVSFQTTGQRPIFNG